MDLAGDGDHRPQQQLGTAENADHGPANSVVAFEKSQLTCRQSFELCTRSCHFSGWFTPTEAAGVGVIYALLLTVVLKRSMTWQRFWDATRDRVVTSAMILMLIAGAGVFGNALSLLQAPQNVAARLAGMNLNTWEFLSAVNILCLLPGIYIGCSGSDSGYDPDPAARTWRLR